MGNMPFNNPAAQAAMINQQNAQMEQLERRREREREKERLAARERSGSMGQPRHPEELAVVTDGEFHPQFLELPLTLI